MDDVKSQMNVRRLNLKLQADQVSAIVRALVELELPVRVALDQLRQDPFGSALSPPIRVSRAHIRRAIEKLLAGAISEDEIREWAHALEIRDDVLPDGETALERDFVSEALLWFSTPELVGSDAYTLAHELAARIGGKSMT